MSVKGGLASDLAKGVGILDDRMGDSEGLKSSQLLAYSAMGSQLTFSHGHFPSSKQPFFREVFHKRGVVRPWGEAKTWSIFDVGYHLAITKG